MHGGAAQRIDAQLEPGRADRVHVDDFAQIVDIGANIIVRVRTGGFDRRCVGDALHSRIVRFEQLIGPPLDNAGDVGVGRAAVGRIVFEAPILGRIVRRRDDDAVAQLLAATVIVYQDGAGNDRRGGHPVIALDDGLHSVGRQHFQRRALSGVAEGMRVFAHE